MNSKEMAVAFITTYGPTEAHARVLNTEDNFRWLLKRRGEDDPDVHTTLQQISFWHALRLNVELLTEEIN
jgi:hypothetical protein